MFFSVISFSHPVDSQGIYVTTQLFLPEELQTASSPPRCSRCPPAGWPSVPAHTAVSDAQRHTGQTEIGRRIKFQTHRL